MTLVTLEVLTLVTLEILTLVVLQVMTLVTLEVLTLATSEVMTPATIRPARETTGATRTKEERRRAVTPECKVYRPRQVDAR